VPIQTVRVDKTGRRLSWVTAAGHVTRLAAALVLSEDRNFYEHGGVDWGALARAAGATPGTRALGRFDP
jgi:penicillin-binding protein 1C